MHIIVQYGDRIVFYALSSSLMIRLFLISPSLMIDFFLISLYQMRRAAFEIFSRVQRVADDIIFLPKTKHDSGIFGSQPRPRALF